MSIISFIPADLEGMYTTVPDSPLQECRICGKRIYPFGNGNFGIKSHARMHVREGTAKELHVQSKRCCAGYDIVFVLAPIGGTEAERELLFTNSFEPAKKKAV